MLEFIHRDMLKFVAKQTKGLSIAQLNELYMSVALQGYYGESIDVEKVVVDLIENKRKTSRQEWATEEEAERKGF